MTPASSPARLWPPIVHMARQAMLPALVFVVTVALHFTYLAVFPEHDAAQDRWLAVNPPAQTSVFQRYIQTQSYWLGYTYGLSLAFAAVALRRYRAHRLCAARNLAIGGVTVSGVLAVASCFLLGCCGSPMLGVYLSLFGAAFLPLAKPLVAGISTLSIAGFYGWMRYRERQVALKASAPPERCGCA